MVMSVLPWLFHFVMVMPVLSLAMIISFLSCTVLNSSSFPEIYYVQSVDATKWNGEELLGLFSRNTFWTALWFLNELRNILRNSLWFCSDLRLPP